MKLDEKGRCCGRKPIHYKGGSYNSPPSAPMFFCVTCDREFSPSGEQRPNWAWTAVSPGEFHKTTKLPMRTYRP